VSDRLDRGLLLLAHGRPALAEEELRAALAEAPNDPAAHAHLALCLSAQEKRGAALAEAETAVALGPDLAFAHYALASVLDDLDRLRDAAARVGEAIRLDPEDANFRALLASVRAQRGEWAEALAAADEGLALDPEHSGCLNLRSLALVKLGRREEAATTVADALARDPEDATTHANRGWALLHEGRAKEALDHFREALRIEPGHEWARAGIVEALKARNFLYRWLLRWSLWMSRFSPRTQILVLVGLYVGYRVALGLQRTRPELRPYLGPLVVLYLLFALFTWLGEPLFDLLLRLDPMGRQALSKRAKRTATAFGLLLLAAAACGVAFLVLRSGPWLLAAVFFAAMTIPVTTSLGAAPGFGAKVLLAWTAALGALGAAYFLAPLTGFGAHASGILGLFGIGFVAFLWGSQLLLIRRPG
jgi:tetratricopeptide (TPR) repeat protein